MKPTTKLTLGFSPCPNDCFIFDALIHHKIDTEGISFEFIMEDVEALNKKAFKGALAISKLSYHAFANLTKFYQLLNAGSALGNNCGPLLITKNVDFINNPLKIDSARIAIPGKYTTANLLLSLAFPKATDKKEMLFSDIEDAVLNGTVGAGLIIHENRFTYEQKGLLKIVDLGEYWETLTGMPIPLGGIVIQRNLPVELKQKVENLIHKSVSYAFANPQSSLPFIKANAQEMEEEVMYKHIDLYVNKYSLDLGAVGKKAIQLLFDKAQTLSIINKIEDSVFL
ncbi:MAG: 1,4-dihydroxy-6-naphthoate synthase [Bacteroidia bacterium]